MTNLNEKTVFVVGGAGSVGEGIVRSLLRAGATVFTTSRKPEKLEMLRDRLDDVATDRLKGIVGNLGDFEQAEKLRDQILAQSDRLDAVVLSSRLSREKTDAGATSIKPTFSSYSASRFGRFSA